MDGDPLLTEELVDWMKSLGRPAMRWILGGKPEGYTRDAARADRVNWLQEERWAKAFSHLDKTEMRLLLQGVERGQSGAVHFEAASEETRQAILSHRSRMAA